jgi:oxygen-independent coproporphyrinogen-3 oxidase
MEAPKDDVAQEHFMILLDTLESNGFIHYESNFGKQNYFSKNNPLIGWEKYMGIGPSAHGYNGISRRECIEQHHLFEVHSGRKTTK